MEKENTPQSEENSKVKKLKFSLWFCIAFSVCCIVFIIVSAVTEDVCFWAGALGFGVLCAEFLRLFFKSKNVLLIVVAVVCFLAFALMFTLWIMGLIT